MAQCDRCGQESPKEARFCFSCGAPLGEAETREARKVVTVVFCDLAGSTALAERLDPEALRRVLARYFSCARDILERHGGTVEKFIGDAVMAVFGVPVVHEDDALRAVRAAADLREAIVDLNADLRPLEVELVVRMGVNTGEVLSGDPGAGQALVTGDAVVTAKRLEEAALDGDILLGPATHGLVRDAVVVEPLPPIALKGKREPLSAYALRSLLVGAPGVARRLDSPLVGRAHELASLEAAFVEAVAVRECRLVTVLGPAGIGKSRIALELAARLAGRARVLSGRCLPYGEGITFWPIVEIVRQAAGLSGEEPSADARARVAELVSTMEDRERIAAGVGAALALGDEANADEIFWAMRRLLEELGREQPLLVVLDDLQWAESVLLDLVEYIGERSRHSPVLLCCLARPELLDVRPLWTAPGGATTVSLDALPPGESQQLIANLLESELPEEVRERVAAAADGNPLFVEELLRMLIDDGVLEQEDGHWHLAMDARRLDLPPTIHALLSARLDRLGLGERLVLERAAVVGEVFSWGVVAALVTPDSRAAVGGHLQALVRKELIRAAPPVSGGEDEFRFRHILIRDAAYAGLPKGSRAELHEQVARWIETRFAGGIEADEIGGYHLEQAVLARRELDPTDPSAGGLAAEAAERLAVAGRRAAAYGDAPAAAALLERALALLDADDARAPELEVELAEALRLLGRFEEAGQILETAAEGAFRVGERGVAQRAALAQAFLRLHTRPSEGTDAFVHTARETIAVFEELGDEAGLTRAWTLLAEAYWLRCELRNMQEAVEHALAAAHGAGRAERSHARRALARAAMFGPMPVHEALRLCAGLAAESEGDRELGAMLDLHTAYLEALDGRFDDARARLADVVTVLEELGRRVQVASQRFQAGQVELLAGDAAAAEAYFREGYELLEVLGERGNLAGLAVYRAAALHLLGRDEEADALLAEVARTGNPDDAELQVLWRVTRARIRLSQGRLDEAEPLAREAVEIAERTDAPNFRANAAVTLAVVLRETGDADEADTAARHALALYEAKGNRVGAGEAAELLTSEGISAS